MIDSLRSFKSDSLSLSGIGVVSSIGQGRAAFSKALLSGLQRFRIMTREGRQHEDTAFIGAEIENLSVPLSLSPRVARTISLSAKAALAVVDEAHRDARLESVDHARLGLIIGGSNVQQRELMLLRDRYCARPEYVSPHYALCFMDTDICGLCTEQFKLQGPTYTVGGASASGLLAIIEAAQAVRSGRVDACIAVGSLMDISHWECQAFRSLNAMGSDRFRDEPTLACRPFDGARDGFIFGESCGAVVVERTSSALSRGIKPYAELLGWATVTDANRNANSSLQGEIAVIRKAMSNSSLSPNEIDYVNTHGTGSVLGDQAEAQAIRECSLNHAYINATKSIIGHGLTSAGAVEVIATLLQMQAGMLHPTLNLQDPVSLDHNWVRKQSVQKQIGNALKLSMGFGGLNAAICLRNCFTRTGVYA